jgi:ribosome-associated toxin RatA of RatAB toxin-antitoxin module
MNRLSAIALSIMIAVGFPIAAQSAQSAQSGSPLAQLPEQEQVALQKGKVILTGQEGHYTGRFLVTASIDTAWKVLIDYDNFQNFLPNVASSRILENNGNQKVFEQVNVVRVFLFSRKSRVVIATSERYPSQIAFRSIAGNLKSLTGSWQLEPISPNRILVTNQVMVAPSASTPGALFFKLYKSALKDSLMALERETERFSVGK